MRTYWTIFIFVAKKEIRFILKYVPSFSVHNAEILPEFGGCSLGHTISIWQAKHISLSHLVTCWIFVALFQNWHIKAESHMPLWLRFFLHTFCPFIHLFETGHSCIVHAGLEFTMYPRLASTHGNPLPQPPECSNCRCAPPCPEIQLK